MEIFYDFNQLKNIIVSKARYQKVMLLHDQSVSNTLLADIYELIKEECVYNCRQIDADISEVYNGFRAIIFVCEADVFLRCKINLDEFVNIFMPTDNSILPYYLNADARFLGRGYLFLTPNNLDVRAISSRIFNQYYAYLSGLIFETAKLEPLVECGQITQDIIVGLIDGIAQNRQLFDVKLLKACGIKYCQLPLLDYILLCAFNCFVGAVYSQQFCLVDVYKAVGQDYDLLDKYYALINNKFIPNIIQLNHRTLSTLGKKCAQQVVELVGATTSAQIDEIISKIKEYSKTSGDLLNYLYLFNVFSL